MSLKGNIISFSVPWPSRGTLELLIGQDLTDRIYEQFESNARWEDDGGAINPEED
jgi:hypothetical protein